MFREAVAQGLLGDVIGNTDKFIALVFNFLLTNYAVPSIHLIHRQSRPQFFTDDVPADIALFKVLRSLSLLLNENR